jgi:hypothetical protein
MQSVAESNIVRDAVAKSELSVETMLTGMRDAVVLGWTLRHMQPGHATADSALCTEHREQVNMLSSEETEEAAPAHAGP